MANEKDEIATLPTKNARTPEQREMQLMALAVDLSEKRLRDGTASSAEIVYWLKQASPTAMLERRNLQLQGELLEAKRDAIRSEQSNNELYMAAIQALTSYRPTVVEGEFIPNDKII